MNGLILTGITLFVIVVAKVIITVQSAKKKKLKENKPSGKVKIKKESTVQSRVPKGKKHPASR